MIRFPFAVSLVALLASPSVAAEGGPHYLARSLEADGSAGAVGSLAALLVTGQTDTNPGLTLAAESLRIEKDRRVQSMHTPAGTVGGESAWTTSYANFTDGSAFVSGVRIGHRVFVAPARSEDPPFAEVQAPAVRLEAGDVAYVEEPMNVHNDGRQPASADTAGSFAVSSDEPTKIRVSGDFLIVLWEADLNVTEVGRKESFRSGARSEETVPLPLPGEPVHVLGDYESAKLYVFVENGTLDLTIATPVVWDAFYVFATGAAAAGSVTLKGALQQDAVKPAAGDLSFQGPVAWTLAMAGDHLEAWRVPEQALGAPEGPAPDPFDLLRNARNTPDAAPSSTAASWNGVPAWLGASLVALALAAAGLALARGLAQARTIRSLRGHMEAGEYEAVVEEVEGALRMRRHGREASVIGVMAALQISDVARARGFLRRARWSLGSEPALEPFLEACIAAASHDEERARTLLNDSLRMDGSLMAYARSNPFLSRVLQPDAPEPGYT